MTQHNGAGADPAAGLKLARIRTLNEIAFIAGDRAHGGPAREQQLVELRRELRELDERIAAADAGGVSIFIK